MRDPASTARSQVRSWLALSFGVLGLFATLLEAIVRLAPLAWAPLRDGMSGVAWLAYVSFCLVNAYAEGYRGFQRAFSPRVAARARVLFREPTLGRTLLAPLFLMGLYDATRRRLLANWVLVLGITALVLAVKRLSQPWRGVVDAGVVVGLAWGTLSTAYFLVQAARGRAPEVDPELRDG